MPPVKFVTWISGVVIWSGYFGVPSQPVRLVDPGVNEPYIVEEQVSERDAAGKVSERWKEVGSGVSAESWKRSMIYSQAIHELLKDHQENKE